MSLFTAGTKLPKDAEELSAMVTVLIGQQKRLQEENELFKVKTSNLQTKTNKLKRESFG